jgi:adenine deaminase
MRTADLLLAGGQALNVFSGALERRDVAIARGRIVGFGAYDAHERLDVSGRVLLPGFCEGHIHIESTMLAPAEFAQVAAAHGTTTVVADPHEIANVAGLTGIRFLAQGAPPELLDLHLMAPSCVPATPFETAGAEIGPEAIAELLTWPQVLGLGEMMNFPGAIGGDPGVRAKLAAAAGRPMDGHAPGVTGPDLMAYMAAGPDSDHETVTLAEGEEKLRLGMWLMAREGSASRNLEALAPLLRSELRHRCLLVSDDLEPGDLLERGHLDHLLRRAVALGVAPLDAVRAVTINVAQRFGLRQVGAIAPGYVADVVAVDDLERFTVQTVLKRGAVLQHEGRWLAPAVVPSAERPSAVYDSMRVAALTADQLAVRADGPVAQVRAIVVHEGLIVTDAATVRLPVRDGCVQPDPAQDVLKLVVVERHGRTGRVGHGFVRGFGLRAGALATTVAHDSHNLLLAGADDQSLLTAAAAVQRLGGGQVVAEGERVLAELPLPVAGLMSDLPVAEVARRSRALVAAAAGLGGRLSQPFMTLSFLALPVIPHLKLTDRGLFDVDTFQFTDLLV